MCKVALQVSTLQVFSLYKDKQQSIFGTCRQEPALNRKFRKRKKYSGPLDSLVHKQVLLYFLHNYAPELRLYCDFKVQQGEK